MDVLVQDEGEKDGADDEVWSWCPVANVVDAHETGQDHHIMHGTKIFSAGTKVYISSEWADTRTRGRGFKSRWSDQKARNFNDSGLFRFSLLPSFYPPQTRFRHDFQTRPDTMPP